MGWSGAPKKKPKVIRDGQKVRRTDGVTYTTLLGGSESCFNPFSYDFFFAYDTFFGKIYSGQTNRPIQLLFRPKFVEMSKLRP